jgi:hypothetical protein
LVAFLERRAKYFSLYEWNLHSWLVRRGEPVLLTFYFNC